MSFTSLGSVLSPETCEEWKVNLDAGENALASGLLTKENFVPGEFVLWAAAVKARGCDQNLIDRYLSHEPCTPASVAAAKQLLVQNPSSISYPEHLNIPTVLDSLCLSGSVPITFLPPPEVAPPAQASTASGKSNFLPIALLVGGVALAALVLGKKK